MRLADDIIVCAERAGEGLADVGGAESRGEVEDRGEDKGGGVGVGVGRGVGERRGNWGLY